MGKKDKIADIIVHPTKSNEDIFKIIMKTINVFVGEFQKKDRLEYLYEADIQASLAYELSKSIGNLELTLQRQKQEITPKNEKLSLITREYPIGKRFDIACINPETIRRYFEWRYKINKNKPIGDNTFFWELPLIAGIEIKYSILESPLGLSGIKNDVEKFNSYKKDYHEKRNEQDGEFTFTKGFQYLALQFFQDDDWFNELTKNEKNAVEEINKFNSIYFIGKSNIFLINPCHSK